MIQNIVLKGFYQNWTFLLTLTTRMTRLRVLKHHTTYDVITSKPLTFLYNFLIFFDREMNCASFAPIPI